MLSGVAHQQKGMVGSKVGAAGDAGRREDRVGQSSPENGCEDCGGLQAAARAPDARQDGERVPEEEQGCLHGLAEAILGLGVGASVAPGCWAALRFPGACDLRAPVLEALEPLLVPSC